MAGLLQRARSKARYWNRVFTRFLELMDALEHNRGQRLFESLTFLMQRAVGALEFADPIELDLPVQPSDTKDTRPEESRFDGLDFEDAALGTLRTYSAEHESSAEELQVLMVIASGALRSIEGNRFDAAGFTPEAILAEFKALGSAALPSAIEACTLLPVGARSAWSSVLKHAEKQAEAMHRLRLEMSTLKVIRALYAMAIGIRRTRSADADEEPRWAWIAFTSGDAYLSGKVRD